MNPIRIAHKASLLAGFLITMAVESAAQDAAPSADELRVLRQKIEDDPKNPRYIVTVHGQGYRFSQ